jgi:2-keto-3-deoxy-L-rhamnonate aldolase RhmA
MSSLRRKLLNGGKSYGPLLFSGSETVAELIAGIGYSHIVVDMEHSPVDLPTTTSILRAIDASSRGTYSSEESNTTPIVRVPSHTDIAMTKRVLDVLRPPCGIMFPMVENAKQAQAAVESTRYAPHYPNNSGLRGCAYPFTRASSYGKNKDYFHIDSNQSLLTIMQVESLEAIENIHEIGLVDGVDCIFLGPFDISCNMGKIGDFSPKGEVMQVIRRAETMVLDTAKEKKNKSLSCGNGLILGGFKPPGRSTHEMFDYGYQFICGSTDLAMLGSAASADFKSSLSKTR